MARPAPTRFNPELLVRNPERLSVAFPVSDCKRLVQLLADETGEFTAEFEVKRVGKQLQAVGHFKVDVNLECQRCLSPFRLPVESDFEFVLVPDEEAANATDENIDPVVLSEDGLIHVVDLFEDELILQVPNVPKHESSDQCEFAVPVVLVDSETESSNTSDDVSSDDSKRSAFAVLKDLKFDSKK